MVSVLQLCIVGINKINILPYLENKNIYSKEVLEEYSDIFNTFTNSKTFFNHGHLLKWQGILDLLPEINTNHMCLTDPAIIIGKPNEINPLQKEILESALLSLSPWRKGPFNLFGLEVDSEWRCENKWKRIKDYLPKNKDMRIADLGCSNGYYSYKLLNLEPEVVVGLDKTPLYIMQFLATKYYANKTQELIVLPCSAEEFSQEKMDFNLILSMGILYHSKKPEDHISVINKLLNKNGFVVLETIISLTQDNINIKKGETFAGMRNIGTIFTKDNLIKLMNISGFKNTECVNEHFTNISEQRATKWIQGKSFKDFIRPDGRTIEGFPPVCRAIFIAQKN